MTTTRLLVPLLVALGAIAACLPSRDNPSDTSNRPVAALSIENGPYVDDLCGISDSLDAVVSRGRCLHLSAAGSTDPQGVDDIASYLFELSTNGQAFVEIPASLSSGTSAATVILAPTALRLQRPGIPVFARVTVTDGDGGHSSAEGTFQLSNSSPVALRPGNRYVPAFGALWRRSPPDIIGGGLTVRLDGSGVDDEGDPLRFCWRERNSVGAWDPSIPCTDEAIADTTVCTATTEYVLDEVAEGGTPESPKAIEYELRVCDGDLWSRPVLASIVHESTPAWGVERDFTRAVIVDATQRTEQIPYPVVGQPGFTVSDTDKIRAYFGFDDPAIPGKDRNLVRTQFVADSAGIAASTVTLDPEAQIRQVVPAPGAGMIWVVASVGSGGLGVYGVYGTGAAATFDGPWLPPDPIYVSEGDGIFTAVDVDTGDLWFSANFQQSVWGLAGDSGTVQEIARVDLADQFPGDMRMVTGIALPDFPNEQQQNGPHDVWIGHSDHVLVPGGGVDPGEGAGLLIRAPSGALDAVALRAEDDVVAAAGALLQVGYGPLFTSPSSFYMFFFGEGVGFFGIKPTTNEAVMVSFAPTGLIGFAGAVHPASGHALYVSDGQQTLFRVTGEGSSATLLTSEPVTDVFRIARGTRLLTYVPEGDSPGRVLLGQGTGVEGLIQRFGIPPAFDKVSQGIDYSSGDLWVPSIIPVGAARYYADGRLADFIHSADDGTDGGAPFGAAIHVSSDPADGALWLVTVRDTSGNANVVWRVDPYGARENAGIVASGGVIARELASPDESVLAMAAQPAVESTSSALVMLVRTDNGDGNFDYSLQRMLPDGTFDPALPVALMTGGAVPQPIFFARDLVTPGVCVASRNPLANQVVVRRYGPTLAAFDQIVFATGGTPPKVVAVGAYDGDCWAAYRVGPNVVLGLTRPSQAGFTAIGLGLPSEPTSIVPVMTADSIRPESSHRVLVSFPEESVLRRYVIRTTSGGLQLLEEDEQIRTDGDVRLLTP